MLLLVATLTLTAQDTTQTAPKPKTKRWGIGLGFGGFYNVVSPNLQFDAANNFPTTSIKDNSYSLDLIFNYQIRKLNLSTIINFNGYRVRHFSDTSGLMNGVKPDLISSERFYKYNLLQFIQRIDIYNINKVKYNIRFGLSGNLLLIDALDYTEKIIAKQNNIYTEFNNSVIKPGGYSFGLGCYFDANARLYKGLHIGLNANTAYLFTKIGGLNKTSTTSPGQIDATKFLTLQSYGFTPIRPSIYLLFTL